MLFIWGDKKLNDRYDFRAVLSFFRWMIFLMEAESMPDTGAQQPSHLWSLEEIEALLSEHKTQPSAQPEPERSPLPGIEGDGPSIALDKAKDAVEEETFEPLLPLFEETGDIFDPLSPPPTAQEAPLQEDAPPPHNRATGTSARKRTSRCCLPRNALFRWKRF